MRATWRTLQRQIQDETLPQLVPKSAGEGQGAAPLPFLPLALGLRPFSLGEIRLPGKIIASRTEGACLLGLSGCGFLGKNVNPGGWSLCPNHPLSVWSWGAEGENISPPGALVPHLKDRNNNFVILSYWHCSEVWLNETQSLSGPICLRPSVAK